MARSMSVAERNRAIKQVVKRLFPTHKVSVRGSRGTAYGWVDVDIDWTPRDMEQAREMKGLVWQALGVSELDKEIGTYGYDDPGSDYGYGNKCSISFNTPRYYRTIRHPDGSMSALVDGFGGDWQTVEIGR